MNIINKKTILIEYLFYIYYSSALASFSQWTSSSCIVLSFPCWWKIIVRHITSRFIYISFFVKCLSSTCLSLSHTFTESTVWRFSWSCSCVNYFAWRFDGGVDFVSNVVDFSFSVQISSNDVVSLNKWIEFTLQIFILCGQKNRMLLQSFILLLQVKISVHQSLVRIVNSFQISILSSLINFKTIVFSFSRLKLSS